MNRRRIRFYGTIAACLFGLAAIGGLLGWLLIGWVLRGHPALAAVAVALVLLGGGLAWGSVRWSPSERIANVRRWFGYRWRLVRRLPWTVLGVLFGMAVVSSLVGLWGAEQGLKELWLNLGTELAGAVVTYILLDLVLGTRQRKESLIAEMGSNKRDGAVAAVEELRQEGWLTDGSLEGADLEGANLKEADLWHAHLKEADLVGAHLERADLVDANLEEARLVGAHLEEANLGGANLEGTNLRLAHLKEANLRLANLRGAFLRAANLGGAFLRAANLEEAFLGAANLEGAEVTAHQLAQAELLAGATLPNGTNLSEENWEAEFEEWRKK